MTFGFGGIATKGVRGTRISELYEGMSRLEAERSNAVITRGMIAPILDIIFTAIDDIQNLDYPTLKTLANIVDDTQKIVDKYHNDPNTSDFTSLVKDPSPQLGGNLDAQSIFKGVNFIDPTANQDIATKKYVDDLSLQCTLTDVTSSRAKGTTYTNGTHAILVQVTTILETAGHATIAYVHPTADPPTILVGAFTDVANEPFYNTITFRVPVGWKYRVNSDGTLSNWIESYLEVD